MFSGMSQSIALHVVSLVGIVWPVGPWSLTTGGHHYLGPLDEEFLFS